MALKIWTVEIRVDFDDPKKNDIMLDDIRAHTKGMLTTARLLADKRKPDVAIQSDDMFEGREAIELFTQEERAEYGIEETQP
jgi:hypothetical protein